ncbi:IclR family transcriptional regulator [Acidovorax soli]|nr:helix-turn-helix domain-containing protein [Acidovorax soli]
MDRENQTEQPLSNAAPTPRRVSAKRAPADPQNHRTVDRVTQILEEVVYRPGMTFAELVRALGAAKSSVHGFIRGLLAKGWLYEDQHRFYLGPAVYGLTLASGHIRAGSVTHQDLVALHEETGLAVFLGVQAGDHLIYIAEAGSDPVAGFEARSNIRRTLLSTAGGKALLAAKSPSERELYLRRRPREEAELVDVFLGELDGITKAQVAKNLNPARMRCGLATAVRSRAGDVVASVTVVGPIAEMEPRFAALSAALVKHASAWARLSTIPREVI